MALDRLRIALSALAAAAQSIEEAPPVPVVRLGMLPLVGVVALPRLLATIAARPNSPRLVVHESTVAGLLGMLRNGDLDCVVGRVESGLEEPAASELLVTPLWEERLAIACALDHPAGRRRMVGLAELRELDWVVAPRGAHTRQVFEETFLSAGIVPPGPKVESFSFHTNLCMVSKSRLLTVAPDSAVQHYAQLGMVHPVRHGISFPAGLTVFVTRGDMATSLSVMLIREDLVKLTAEAAGGLA
ncbi:LysR substrate-binding domain-containing protein [Cupriavidus basilensis]